MFGMIRNSLFGNSEETEYKVLSSETKNGVGFEVRRYDAAKYAAIYSEGRTYDQVIGELVRKLLTYIGGNNEQGEAMGIAFPIIITVYPRNDGVFSRRLAVGIRIPNAYQQDPPAPTDSAIRVEERSGMTVYAMRCYESNLVGSWVTLKDKNPMCTSHSTKMLKENVGKGHIKVLDLKLKEDWKDMKQFGGFAGESEYRAEASRLTRTLGETTPFQRKQYFCCSYDPPLKPYGRRNEVWFLQEDP